MKKFLKILAVVVITLPILAFGWLTYTTEKNRAAPRPEALAALEADDSIRVELDDWLIMRPESTEPIMGVILYPGANCDIRGYAPVLRRIAAEGYLVVTVSMPFDFAIFSPDRADDVRAAFPNIERWIILGHSMGGAMAGRYAFLNQNDLAGLILWDSYPPEGNSLADSDLPVWHIHRAKPDGTPAQKFTDNKYLFPESSVWIPIPGGIHMYFGSFDGGGYVEEWEPEISREEHQEIAVRGTLDALRAMTG